MAGERQLVEDGMSGAREASAQVRYWTGEIAAAMKREKDWRHEGRRILDIYNGKKKDSIPFNILYSNTETYLPALYNAQPRPVVQRRFKDEDPIGKLGAQAGVRVLEFSVDTNSEEYSPFDDVMTDAVVDALLPGRGTSRVKYDAEVYGQEGSRTLKSQLVCYESVKWDKWIFGFAKKWKKVPWIAFEHDVTYSEAKELFGEAKAKQMKYVAGDAKNNDDDRDTAKDDQTDEEDRKTAKVWEIWHKAKKEVRFFSPTYLEGYLKVDEDPLGLTGFYPVPEPLRFLRKSNDQMPTALYTLYENQAKELNRISTRINKVVEALKVRGAYDSTLGGDIENILNKDDNAMIGAENVAALENGGLEKAIWLMPIDKLVVVLQQLIIARQQCKQVIYEITGISDILRGQSVASETATAQEIKNQWGTLRLKRLQKEVQRYARDMLRITLEIAAKHFNEKTFAQMTGLPFATKEERQAAEGKAAAIRSAQAMGMQVPPQEAQETMATLQKPTWDAVLKVLRNDTERQYRIDVETNSTVDLEATEDKKMMEDVLQAVGSFLQGVTPLIVSGAMPFQAAQGMLLAIVRRYRFGPEIEDYIKAMKQPTNPDEGKQKAEMAKQQAEQQRAQEMHQMELQKLQAEMAMREKEMQMEMAMKEREHQLKLAELEGKLKVAEIMAKIKIAEAEKKLQLLTQQKAVEVAAAQAMPKDQGADSAKKEGATT